MMTPTELRELIDIKETPYMKGDKVNRILSFCFDITYFYHGGLFENETGILDFYRKSMEIIGDDVTYYLVDGEGRFKKRKKDTLELLPKWVAERRDSGIHGINLETGMRSGDFTDKAFQTSNIDDSSGWSRLILPAEWLMENGPGKAFELAVSLGEKLNYSSGSAGYAVNQSWKRSCSDGIDLVSHRFPGIEVASPHHFQRFLPWAVFADDDSIRSINWLTMICDKFVKRLGGKKRAASHFSDSVTSESMKGGMIFRAGDKPRTGDVESGEKLSEYMEVGSALKGLLIPDEVLGPWNSIGGTEENTRRWLHRFDGDG